ncbi:MAG: group 1 truncated hemoglobin [Terriglobia bacterium]
MPQSLYERLGGRRKIEAIINDAVDLHLKNPAIAPRFQKHDIAKLKQLGSEFFCVGAGGPETYSGRDMRTAHSGMNISEQEFLATIDDIVKAMDKNGIGPQEKNEVIAVLYSLKAEVVRV